MVMCRPVSLLHNLTETQKDMIIKFDNHLTIIESDGQEYEMPCTVECEIEHEPADYEVGIYNSETRATIIRIHTPYGGTIQDAYNECRAKRIDASEIDRIEAAAIERWECATFEMNEV